VIWGKRALLAACLALLLAPASAAAAFGPPGGIYAGKISTNQGKQASHPFTLGLTANGKRIKSFVIYWHTKPCTGSGTDFAGGLTASRTPIRRDGSLSGTIAFSEANPDDATQKLAHRVELSGRLGPKRAAGSYRDVVTITNAAGATLGTCDTGTVRWSAARGKGTFGGGTAQHMPAGVTRSGKRAGLFLHWRADCGGGTFLERTLQHKGIRVRRGGAFSKSGSLSFTTDKGAKVTGTFSLTGKFSRRRVSGRYTVNAVGTSTSGQQFNCKLDRLRYSAARG
jgi:hypothetical protein